MTRLPAAPSDVRLLPDARLYQVWKTSGENKALEASFSALESAVEHIGWMLRNEPMQRLQLDILPPVEVQAPCSACDERLLVSTDVARRILSGELAVYHSAVGHRVLSAHEHQHPIQKATT